MKNLRVAMIAPPWLAIPPTGYGGTENVIAGLVPALREAGVVVELFTTGDTTLKTDRNHFLYKTAKYSFIHKPQYETFPLIAGHILAALHYIRDDGHFDVIHDHNTYLGPAILASINDDRLPPSLHTLHGPPFSSVKEKEATNPITNRPFWRYLPANHRLRLVGISRSMMRTAPLNIRKMSLGVVHNGVNPSEYSYWEKKSDYFITLARFHPDKGQHLAVRACQDGGYRLKLAGVIGDLKRPKDTMLQLANPLSPYRSLVDFRYFSDEIFPHLEDGFIDYLGDVHGEAKQRLVSRAKALLFPVQWEEPFGMAVIEALACGTPVVAMNRGAMAEIIKPGVTGWLARNEREFRQYLKRVDEIDPALCRLSVEERFSTRHMANKYIERYFSLLRLNRT